MEPASGYQCNPSMSLPKLPMAGHMRHAHGLHPPCWAPGSADAAPPRPTRLIWPGGRLSIGRCSGVSLAKEATRVRGSTSKCTAASLQTCFFAFLLFWRGSPAGFDGVLMGVWEIPGHLKRASTVKSPEALQRVSNGIWTPADQMSFSWRVFDGDNIWLGSRGPNPDPSKVDDVPRLPSLPVLL